MTTFKVKNSREVEVYFDHSIQIGTMKREVNGYYYFYFDPEIPCLGDKTLTTIAEELERLNKAVR